MHRNFALPWNDIFVFRWGIRTAVRVYTGYDWIRTGYNRIRTGYNRIRTAVRIYGFVLTMAYTLSNMLPLGTIAPDFELPEPGTGNNIRLNDIKGARATVVMFLCNHCPYVLYINAEIVRIAQEYGPKGVQFVGINSNDAETHPDDAPEKMGPHASTVGYTFPYLYDETQEVARQYDAACTPDFYVFDADLKLAYRGQLDGSRPKRNPVEPTGEDLRAALDAVLSGQPAAEVQRPSGGCNIKWKEA